MLGTETSPSSHPAAPGRCWDTGSRARGDLVVVGKFWCPLLGSMPLSLVAGEGTITEERLGHWCSCRLGSVRWAVPRSSGGSLGGSGESPRGPEVLPPASLPFRAGAGGPPGPTTSPRAL